MDFWPNFYFKNSTGPVCDHFKKKGKGRSSPGQATLERPYSPDFNPTKFQAQSEDQPSTGALLKTHVVYQTDMTPSSKNHAESMVMHSSGPFHRIKAQVLSIRPKVSSSPASGPLRRIRSNSKNQDAAAKALLSY